MVKGISAVGNRVSRKYCAGAAKSSGFIKREIATSAIRRPPRDDIIVKR